MVTNSLASWFLGEEARALLTRLARVKPFALYETMVPAAGLSQAAQIAIERYLVEGRGELRRMVNNYIRWLNEPEGHNATPTEAQRRFTFLRMRFNVVLSQFDLFAAVLTQHSEQDNGVWLSGLDAVSADALNLHGKH